jgi:signal transduction histidine kinase
MKLAHKLTASLVAGILAVMGTYAIVQIRNEVTLFRADVKKNTRIGRSLKATIEEVWRAEGEARARELVEEADDENQGLGVRIVRLDGPAGVVPRPTLGPDDLAALAGGGGVRFIRENDQGDRRRYTYLPLDVAAPGTFALELFESLHEQLTYVRMNRIGIVTATFAVTGVCALIVLYLASLFVSRPIQQLRDQARRIGAGDFSQRLSLRQRDEIGELAGELNAMCDMMVESHRRLADETEARVSALEQLRHTDRLATVGKLASGVAHQLGTPLNVVSIRAKMIGSQTPLPDEVRDAARIIAEQADRMTEIIRRLLDFSRRRSISRGRRELGPVVARTLELIAPVAQKRRVVVEQAPGDAPIFVEVDEAQLQQALANIVLNGIQAMDEGGRLRVRVGQRAASRLAADAPAEHAFVAIEDEGPGIEPERLAELFEPFFTTKAPGEGTGLGLSVAEGIVEDHDGWIDVASTPGRGACFTVYLKPLPRADVGQGVEDAAP